MSDLQAKQKLEDLQAQADLLEMNVDIESWTLVPRKKKVNSSNYFFKSREDHQDYMTDGSDDQEYDDER